MPHLATITSKRQLTIPSAVFASLGWQTGQRLLVQEDLGVVKLQPVHGLVDKLAGSVKLPERFKSLSVDQVVKKSKAEYFKSKDV